MMKVEDLFEVALSKVRTGGGSAFDYYVNDAD